MIATPLPDIIRDGLWRNNAGLVQMLGLCPLLAVTTTTVNAVGLGIATTVVLLLSNIIASLARPVLRPEIRIALFVLVIAGLVTVVDLYMHARFFELHRELGIFVPLIVSNCAILARAEVFASRTDPLRAALDGLMTGAGFMLALVVAGTLREVVGRGTVLANAHMLLGESWRSLTVQLFDGGFIVAALPPGAFIIVGLLIALRNMLAGREVAAALPVSDPQAKPE